MDPGLAALALNVDAGGCAAHNPVVPNFDKVVRPCLEHDAPRFEVVEIAVFDDQVGIDGDNACSVRSWFVIGVTPECAAFHLKLGALQDHNARHFVAKLARNSTIRQNQIISEVITAFGI